MIDRLRFGLAPFLFAMLAAAPQLCGQQAVRVVRPERTDLREGARLPGRLLPEASVMLRARVTGVLAEIPVDHGSPVGAGGLLARLDVPELHAAVKQRQATLAEAEAGVADAQAAVAVAAADVTSAESKLAACTAEIELARIIHERKRRLLDQRGATREQVDEAQGRLRIAQARGEAAQAAIVAAAARSTAAESAVVSAQARRDSEVAALDAARIQLGFAELTSPFVGVVVRRHLDPGELVQRDETVIVEVQRTDRLRAEMHVPERDAVKVRPGTTVDMQFDALPEAPRSATVSRVSGSVTAQGVMKVEVDLDNADGSLLPGMFVYANIILRVADGALTVPATSVRQDAQGSYVLVVEASTARRRAVQVGYDNGVRAEIVGGVTEQDRVVLSRQVVDGAAVRAVEDQEQR